jgi:F0F1-type ATP synthase membrane subunit b/b'
VVHDVRELKATRYAHDLVQNYNPKTQKEAEKARREISEEVGKTILNDKSKMMAAKSYISPTVFGRWAHLGLTDVKRG